MLKIYVSRNKGNTKELAQKAFRMYSGRSEVLSYDDLGKPMFDSAFVSISHSSDMWICAISDRPCGIDIEKRRRVDHMKIARRFFTETEVKEVTEKGIESFFRIWTAKEAYAKYTGLGFFRTYRESPLNMKLRLTSLDIAKGYTACLCTETEYDGSIEVFDVD